MIAGGSRAEGTTEPTALIFDVLRFATEDGPGIRTTVFFKGCPLACAWCHNPESQGYGKDVMYFEERCRGCGDCAAVCPEHAIGMDGSAPRTDLGLCQRCGFCLDYCQADARRIAGKRIALSELVSEIERDTVFFEESGGGVTLSGGEPASQPRFVLALLRACRARAIHTALETSGFLLRETFLEIAMEANAVMFDLKLMDEDLHRRYTGVANTRIRENLEALVRAGRKPIVRIPVVPGVNDGAVEARRFARYLADLGISEIELLLYHRNGSEKYRRLGSAYSLAETPEARLEHTARLAAALEREGLFARIRG